MDTAERYYRKVIHIRGEDSPNVRLALAQIARGEEPTGECLVEGVLPWADYEKRRATWDPIRQCIGLDARFYKGADLLLFPPTWLNRAEQLFLRRPPPQAKRWMGVDPAEGGDMSSWAIGDIFGLLKLESLKTPNTTVVTSHTLMLMREHKIEPENVGFDAGGGGKEHADRLRLQGWPVRTVAFGKSLVLDPKRGMRMFKERVENLEDRYAYTTRRVQLYHEFSQLLDPNCVARPDGTLGHQGYAIPTGPIYNGKVGERWGLRGQLAVFPRQTDEEGRFKLPPKQHTGSSDEKKKIKSLIQLIGHSPDEADAVVVMCHMMLNKAKRMAAGAV